MTGSGGGPESQGGLRRRVGRNAAGNFGRWRRRRRAVGCLLWVLTILVTLLVLSILFGGFRTGTKVGGGQPNQVRVTAVREAR